MNVIKGSSWKLLSRNDNGSTLYNTRELTQDGVFDETNFVQVPKIHEIHKFMALEKECPMVFFY